MLPSNDYGCCAPGRYRWPFWRRPRSSVSFQQDILPDNLCFQQDIQEEQETSLVHYPEWNGMKRSTVQGLRYLY